MKTRPDKDTGLDDEYSREYTVWVGKGSKVDKDKTDHKIGTENVIAYDQVADKIGDLAASAKMVKYDGGDPPVNVKVEPGSEAASAAAGSSSDPVPIADPHQKSSDALT